MYKPTDGLEVALKGSYHGCVDSTQALTMSLTQTYQFLQQTYIMICALHDKSMRTEILQSSVEIS